MLDLSTAPDQDIVNRARNGDEPAQRELVRRFRPVVYKLVLRMVRREDAAEDMTQEILLRLFDKLEEHGPTGDAAAWIRQVAKNATLDYVRRARPDAQYKRDNVAPGRVSLAAPPSSHTPRNEPDPDEFERDLRRAIRRLPPEERECARLFFQKDWTHAEIAEKLRWPLGTVKSTIRRIKQQLQEPLGHWRDALNGD